MSQYDLLVRNGILVTATDEQRADLAVADGRIVALGLDLSGTSNEEINAEGLHVFPGVIDSHVHFNEPGPQFLSAHHRCKELRSQAASCPGLVACGFRALGWPGARQS